MSALAGGRVSTPALPMHPNVLLIGSERNMEGTFGIVTQRLLSLCSFPIENLAHSSKADLEGFDLPNSSLDAELRPGLSQPPPDSGPAVLDDKESQKLFSTMQFVAQLHQTCIGAFGNSEALKFEFLEEVGREDKKQCILTIARPNGQTRSYVTEPEFSRKSDAKARAAAIAIERGAIDFILYGNKDALDSRSKVILAPLDSTNGSKQDPKTMEDCPAPEEIEDEASKQIQALCVEWRAGRVQPRWVFYQEHKTSPYYGCVLVIELSPHSQRLYSSEPAHISRSRAKAACSEAAVREGVVDFIKFGNGQTAPSPPVVDPLNDGNLKREPDIDRKGRMSSISLQAFFDSLPKPFPETFGDKSVADLNVQGILNTTLQLAKGSRLNMQFYFLNENSLHGSIIRLSRPEETRTYMVDTRFSKRNDAKAAVCFQAMSQGISKYIRSIAAAVDNMVTPEMRSLANEKILPILGSEYGQLRQGMHPAYDFGNDQGAFSCTMTVSLCADPKPEETKTWSVGPKYRTKTDAKIAVVCLAGKEAIEFVRFRGQEPEPDHDPFKPNKRKRRPKDTQNDSTESSSEQRPQADDRRPMSASSLVRLGLPVTPLLETKEEARERQMASTRWEHTGLPQQRLVRHRPLQSLGPLQQPPPLPGPSRGHDALRQAPSYSRPSHDAPAVMKSTASNSAPPRPPHRGHRFPPAQSHTYLESEVTQLRPPRRSQQYRRPTQTSLSPDYSSSAPSHSAPLNNTQSVSKELPSTTLQNSQSNPAQAFVQPQQVMQYGGPPQPQQPVLQFPPFGPGPYHAGYAQPPYQYSSPQSVHYPPPPNSYPFPVSAAPPPAPPAYGVPYSAYTAYYADPRYAQYNPYAQYNVPGAPVPYAVPVTPTPGLQHSAVPPPAVSTTPPGSSVQSNISLPTPPRTASVGPDELSGAQDPEITVSPTRTTSLNSDSDRQKRPRSRDMSMSPEDAQLHKKHRSDPSLPNIKRESISASPSPPTPISGSKVGLTNVDQLLQYCESEGLPWPEFGSKQMKNERGEGVFKVWIVMGKERLELPLAFLSENEGRQRVAKQVLQRLRSRSVGK